jgi:LacI family transcriptional regulator
MTVSRVTSGSPSVIAETRARVQAVINELGYVPNVDARNLKSPGQRKIGLLYGNPSASYSNELVVSVLGSLSRLGYQLLLEKCASRRSERSCAEKVIKGGVSGVILPTPLCDSIELLHQFDEAGIPTVLVGTGRENASGSSVRIDNFRAAHEMTRYVQSLGHHKIGFIQGHPQQIDSAQRYQGYREAMREAGLPINTDWVKQGYYTYRSGLTAGEEILSGRHRPTAIFASNDDMAAGALTAAHKLRISVPEELSVVGFDDSPVANIVWPSLTTIRQPIEKLTKLALSMLLEEIKRHRSGAPRTDQQKVIRLSLVERESAGPKPQ